MSNEQGKAETPAQRAVELMMRAFTSQLRPFLMGRGSFFFRIEIEGTSFNVNYLGAGASPEIVMSADLCARGAAPFLGDIVGQPVSVMARQIPQSEMDSDKRITLSMDMMSELEREMNGLSPEEDGNG